MTNTSCALLEKIMKEQQAKKQGLEDTVQCGFRACAAKIHNLFQSLLL